MAFTKGRALLIGVGSHAFAPALNVPVTVADALAVAEVLKDADACGYEAAHVNVLSDAGATRQGIVDALNALGRDSAETDTVFVFYAGHGEYDTTGRFCLFTHDAKRSADLRKVEKGTGLDEPALLKLLREIKAKRMLLVFNACHSGEISPDRLGGAPVNATLGTSGLGKAQKENLLATGAGRVIITACGEKDESSWIGRGNLTIFTQALVDGLRGDGVTSRNGFISVYDLYQHVYETVHDAVLERYKTEQNPELTVVKGIGSFAVALCRGASTLGGDDEMPAELPALGKVTQVKPEKIASIVNNTIETNSGNAMLVGHVAGDAFMGDKVAGDKFTGDKVMGDKVQGNKIGRQINTDGGAYVGGSVTAGGDFVGRDKTVTTTSASPGEMAAAMATLLDAVKRAAPPDKQADAQDKVGQIQREVSKGDGADDASLADLVQDLAELAPSAAESIAGFFTNSVVAKAVGAATRFVLGRIKKR